MSCIDHIVSSSLGIQIEEGAGGRDTAEPAVPGRARYSMVLSGEWICDVNWKAGDGAGTGLSLLPMRQYIYSAHTDKEPFVGAKLKWQVNVSIDRCGFDRKGKSEWWYVRGFCICRNGISRINQKYTYDRLQTEHGRGDSATMVTYRTISDDPASNAPC